MPQTNEQSESALSLQFKVSLVVIAVGLGSGLAWLSSQSHSNNEQDKKHERSEERYLIQKDQIKENRDRIDALERGFTKMSTQFEVFQTLVNKNMENTSDKLHVILAKMETIDDTPKELFKMNEKLGNIYRILDDKPIMEKLDKK